MSSISHEIGLSVQAEEPDLSVVIPLFNEEENLHELHRQLTVALEPLGISYEILLVDDGSRDGTARLMRELQRRDPRLATLFLSRNFGHQAAVSAGLDHAQGRAVVVMDGDLQDPPELLPEMYRLWLEGNDVVYAVRRTRKESWPKRLAYATFYRVLRALSDLDIPLDSGDFGLMDRRVVDVLRSLPERRRFVRGLRTFVGFRQVGLPYDRPARAEGKSKYSLPALFGLAVDGLVSFSGYPLRLVTYLGITTASFAALMMAWVFLDAFHNQTAPRGWASTIVVVLFMGSIQLVSLGIIGEYIRLIFLEAKGRPAYVVHEYQPSQSEPASRPTLRLDSARSLLPGPHRHPRRPKARRRPASELAARKTDPAGVSDPCEETPRSPQIFDPEGDRRRDG
ncbi:glycosyltransferase family 2 protein [Singulisphaera sp. PoT]|uniref:glycosyltransferase family 2 protein n=1 Tax=Singulisphaera sp. PoT TaxID=3411797 RepID=UPI003BF477BD